MMDDNKDWDYFSKDTQYSDVLKDRLATGVEMDSAKALGTYLDKSCDGDLRVLDFGAGPGHYFPVLMRATSVSARSIFATIPRSSSLSARYSSLVTSFRRT
jgi:hypothetical protein